MTIMTLMTNEIHPRSMQTELPIYLDFIELMNYTMNFILAISLCIHEYYIHDVCFSCL
jgi:hypothetical protein